MTKLKILKKANKSEKIKIGVFAGGFTHKHVLSEQIKKHFGVHLGKMKK